LKKLIATSVLALSLVATPITFAQDYYTNPDTQGGTTPTINQNDGTTGTTTDNNQGIDWRWFLPLALLPIAFLLFNRKEERSDRREYRSSSQAAYHDISRDKKDSDED
jgi:hypothetical protein